MEAHKKTDAHIKNYNEFLNWAGATEPPYPRTPEEEEQEEQQDPKVVWVCPKVKLSETEEYYAFKKKKNMLRNMEQYSTGKSIINGNFQYGGTKGSQKFD